MKILMTIENYLPTHLGGAEVHCMNIIKSLRARGCEVTLLTAGEEKLPPAEESGIVRFDRGWTGYFRLLSYLLRNVPKYDVVHAHYCHKYAMIAGVVAKLWRKPLVVTLHGYGILDRKGPWTTTLIHDFARWASLKLSTRIISTSEDLAVHVPKYTDASKVKLVYNGVDSAHFLGTQDVEVARKRERIRGKVLLTVRRFNDKNGIQFLIRAIVRLRNRYPDLDFRYWIIGWGKHEDMIKRTIAENRLEDRVEFLGRVGPDRVPAYLQASDIVLFPSSAESVSLAAVEAMLTGNLIVSSRVGGLIELLGPNAERGLYMKMFDWEGSNYHPPEDLAEDRYDEMVRVIYDAIVRYDDYRDRIERGRAYVEANFDWSRIAAQTEREFRVALGELPAPIAGTPG
jgi:glycosyltransferase involved in cell wall biosynthesis